MAIVKLDEGPLITAQLTDVDGTVAIGDRVEMVTRKLTTEGERGVLANLQRKAAQADKMFDSLVAEMNAALHISGAVTFAKPQEVPQWLCMNN